MGDLVEGGRYVHRAQVDIEGEEGKDSLLSSLVYQRIILSVVRPAGLHQEYFGP